MSLKHFLDYNSHQAGFALAEERKNSDNKLGFKEPQLILLNVDKDALHLSIEELEAKLSHTSEAGSKQFSGFVSGYLQRMCTGLTPK